MRSLGNFAGSSKPPVATAVSDSASPAERCNALGVEICSAHFEGRFQLVAVGASVSRRDDILRLFQGV